MEQVAVYELGPDTMALLERIADALEGIRANINDLDNNMHNDDGLIVKLDLIADTIGNLHDIVDAIEITKKRKI